MCACVQRKEIILINFFKIIQVYYYIIKVTHTRFFSKLNNETNFNFTILLLTF